MNILEYYLEMNKDEKWVETFQSTSDRNEGKTFMYINTNFRSIVAFVDTFDKFKVYNGIDRVEWDLHPDHHQEKAKQWVVRMRQSKLFRQNGNVYQLTAKGQAFDDLTSVNMNINEEWYLLYLFLLTSYFNLTPNYITKKTNIVFDTLQKLGYENDKLLLFQNQFLMKKDLKLYGLFSSEIFWIVSFYQDKDFVTIFRNSSEQDKRRLYEYVVRNYENRNYGDCISYKFKPSGQYSINTFIDDIKTLYFTQISKSIKNDTTKYYFTSLLKVYYEIYQDVNQDKILNFIECHQDVFDIILKEFYETLDEDMSKNYEYKPRNIIVPKLNVKYDDTTTKNTDNIEYVRSVLKRIAKERNDYECELSNLNACRYFTSRENNNNYLEIHHLIPREFSNEFENSIEILDNYVPLCPHCHRLLHNATDRERQSSLTFIYNKRRLALKEKSWKRI